MSEVRTMSLEPIVKEKFVTLEVEQAFDLFTKGVQEWWPLATHSVAQQHAAGVRFETRRGGRIVETDAEGREHVWGTVLTFDRPDRLVFTWHPGRDETRAQEVEVTFSSVDGGTSVRLEHGGWESHGEEARSLHENYQTGWDLVLARFRSAST